MLTFLAVGGGGGGFPAARFAIDDGFDSGFGGAFLRLARGLGTAGAESVDPGRGGLKLGTEGAGMEGGRGAELTGSRGIGLLVSESECAPSAPVSIPPRVFFSFGMPPAKRPPSWGALGMAVSPPVSLLLRARFPPGTGGARPLGALIPGTGGAPATGPPPPPPELLSSTGAERSFVTAFFSLVPLVISPSKAS